MNRKPQTFSRTVNGKTTRFYDPRTPDNRKRAKWEFGDAKPYSVSVADKFWDTKFALYIVLAFYAALGVLIALEVTK